MFTASDAIARIQDTRPAIALIIGAVTTAGPPTIATMSALPLTSLAAPLSALSPSPIITWALSVPPLWSEEMTPTRHALLLGITTETWKASLRIDRWNCQPRRGVMLHSARFTPFIFPMYSLAFPLYFPYRFTSSFTRTPQTAIIALYHL